jgi:hypothetical protein
MTGVPLELVKYDVPTGKFIVGDKALDVLRKVKGPLGVVAVCGRARQGKSYILNQLLQQTSGHGFTVGPTHRPCTKGLWMWSAPQRRVAADGSESWLVRAGAGSKVVSSQVPSGPMLTADCWTIDLGSEVPQSGDLCCLESSSLSHTLLLPFNVGAAGYRGH